MAADSLRRQDTGFNVGILDPRSKLVLMVIMSFFVLGGAGSGVMNYIRPVLCIIPFFLLFCRHRFGAAAFYAVSYTGCYVLRMLWPSEIDGILGLTVLFITDIFCRFLPGYALAYYTITSTTVSEFNGAMERMHVPEKIIIPLSVMFRFFPTVMEEIQSINCAMRMRGIRLGGTKIDKMLEYRLVPLMVCSLRIGEELSAAALVRGLGAPIKRTNICKIGFHFQDIVILILCGATVIVYILSLIGRL